VLCIQRAHGDDDHRFERRGATRNAYLSFHSDRTVWAYNRLNAVSQVTCRTGDFIRRAALAFIMASAACEPVINQVRVEPGTAPMKPVFVLTDTTGRGSSGTIYGLSVVPCGADSAVWQIAATGSNSPPARLDYGVAPTGYITRVGPEVLRAGCYDVFVTDGRRARFRVNAAGQVTAETNRGTGQSARPDSARR
jgi:hypothetical protein